jgi:hypothetical protein
MRGSRLLGKLAVWVVAEPESLPGLVEAPTLEKMEPL